MFYGPLLVLLPSILFIYLVMLCKLSRNRKNWKGMEFDHSEHASKIMSSETVYLLAYPLIFFFLALPLVATRAHSWAGHVEPIIPLWHVAVICFDLLGAAIALAFLLNKDTRTLLKWTHIRAAFCNYAASRGISEYETGESVEHEAVARKHKMYAHLSGESTM
jgi:SNF family Na+-dependent transporter